ncbi:MAG: DEAD/DEAH box helicase [Candidatus Omnitrophica bacterium]|nr:DEAD/DEAH box helicase [Candidatus Omnitrophota bacterium]MCG2704933.1 DEAD/DEAH box helicase [Candidatus Omnitrophota bacterium]
MQYDPFQQKAIDYIKEGHSVIVSAPTGSGKTAIAEYVINDCLAKNTYAIYTAPIKALSNQKFRDFQGTFKDKIGILTGDVSINPHAPILIMTTEIFRNKVLEEESDLQKYSWIIFDEIHYLDDYERGTVWEESLIFLPKHMNMLALSATIPNIDELSAWIQSIHKKPLKVVKEDKRPVPLHFFYQCQGELVDSLGKVKHLGYKTAHPAGRHSYRGSRFMRHHTLKPNKTTVLVKHLFENNKLPCIYFSFGRRRCEYLAEEMFGFDFLNTEEKSKIRSMYHDLCERFDLLSEKSATLMMPLLEKGIAYHHAGMLPTLKEVIERLFTSKLIKVIFTTETFALGINMPARTVAFDELRKFYGKYYGTLKTRDFYQMAGRAGRRGIDKEGFVYSRVNPHYTSFQELEKVIYGYPEKVHSRFNASYATILNLYEKYGEKLYDIYPLSFHYFQEKKQSQKKAIELLQSKVKLLKDLGYIKAEALTEKGSFASKIYGYELSLSELYEKGVLEHLSESELGMLSLALVFEPRKGSVKPPLSKKAKESSEITENILNHIQYMEKKAYISPLSKRYFYHLTPALEAWMRKESFEKTMRHTEDDEGEIIRYFRMAVQILDEILETPASLKLKEKIRNTISLINRDIIDAEKQLRE